MKIKKYVAKTLPEALKLVREDLGQDAVILNSRPVETEGFMGFFKKKKVEVIAALDEMPPIRQSQSPSEQSYHYYRKQAEGFTRDHITLPNTNDPDELRKELAELKRLVRQLSNQSQDERQNVFPDIYRPILVRLQQHGVELDYEKLARNVLPEYYQKNGRMSEGEAVRGVRDFLIQELRSIPISWQPQHHKKYLCLIGPTGVGKTTTLVKIAAHFVLERKEKISFITIDTYRIGAVEQLKTYGEILNVPVYVCYEKSDFYRALAQSADCDRVLIDTVGRNYFETEHVKDLLRWFDRFDEMETYFVLSLTMKEDDARDVYEQFSHVPIDGFIFTKFDETKSFGSLYNLPLAFEKPVAYVTTGQEVPDDIVKVKPEWIVQQITGAVRS